MMFLHMARVRQLKFNDDHWDWHVIRYYPGYGEFTARTSSITQTGYLKYQDGFLWARDSIHAQWEVFQNPRAASEITPFLTEE